MNAAVRSSIIMLKITQRVESNLTILEVEGKLTGPWVEELYSCCRERLARGAKLCIDLQNVSFIDAQGKATLSKLHQEGATIVGRGCLTRAIIAQVTGQPGSDSCLGKSESPKEPEASKPAETKHDGTKIVIILMAIFLGGTSVLAQGTQPLKLTLHAAVALALKQNPQTLVSEFQAKEVGEQRTVAFAGLLPQVNADANETRLRENLEALFGRQVPGFPTVIGPFSVFAVGAQFEVPLLDLSTIRTWQASKLDASAAHEQYQVTREEVALMVTTEYLNILRAAADVRAAESRVQLAQALYDQASDLQKNGAGTGIDTLRSNVELQNEKQRLIQANTDHDVAIFQLQRLLGVDPEQPIELTDEMSFYETPDISVDQSLDKAWQTRPEMRQLNQAVNAAETRKRAAWDTHLPTVDANGFWEEQGLQPSSVIPVYTYEAEIKVPIFSGGRTHAEVKEAEYEVDKLKQQRLDMRNEIAVEVRTAFAQLESARQQVDVAKQGLDLAQQEVQQSRDRFAAGVANNVEVVQAQDALSRANDNQITALYAYNTARANLAHAVGQMETLYSK
jgi:outer membrane protein